jgi:hypothetical protein
VTTTFKARYKDGKLEPLEPTRFDEDAVLNLTAEVVVEEEPLDERWARLMNEAALPESERKRPFAELLDEVASMPRDRIPEDEDDNVAINHDHYLYGAPKRIRSSWTRISGTTR